LTLPAGFEPTTLCVPPRNQGSWKHSLAIRKISPGEPGCFLPPPTSFKSFQRPKNSTKNRPAYAEQMAGEFLLVSLQDGVYSIEKFKKGRTEYRWHFSEHHPLSGPPGFIQ
jgi:hypothetical protein